MFMHVQESNRVGLRGGGWGEEKQHLAAKGKGGRQRSRRSGDTFTVCAHLFLGSHAGNASRICGVGEIWSDPNISNSSHEVFTMALVAVSLYICILLYANNYAITFTP